MNKISLIDEDNNLLDFNNIDWNITLVLENVRLIPDKPPKFKDLITEAQGFESNVEPVAEKPIEPIQDIKDLELLNA